MPKRLEFFYRGGFYHIFNKTIDHKLVFSSEKERELFKEILLYYQFTPFETSFSESRRLKKISAQQEPIDNNKKAFTCLAYCFMPNHFHLLLKQDNSMALSHVLRRVLISFTRTYNLLNNRKGPLFLPQFKTVEINNQNQLTHVSRYIHLNPFSAGMLSSPNQVLTCPIGSMPAYYQSTDSLCETESLLLIFHNNRKKYCEFVLDQADYQKRLAIIKKSVAL